MSLAPGIKGPAIIALLLGAAVLGWFIPSGCKVRCIIAEGTTSVTINAGAQNAAATTVYTGPPNPVNLFASNKAWSGGNGGEVPVSKFVLIGNAASLTVFRTLGLVSASALTSCMNLQDPLTGGYEWDGASDCTVSWGSAMSVTVYWALTS